MRKINSIFLIEDSEIDTWIALKVLEFSGISPVVLNAFDGPNALRQLESFAAKNHCLPEILLIDLNLPIMDGFEVIARIKNMSCFNHKQTQLILISEGLDSYEDLPRIQQHDIRFVILKPLSKEKLEEAIRNFETRYP